MRRLYWVLAFAFTFLVGLAAASVVRSSPSAMQEVERLRATVSHLEQQIATLQARLRARESAGGPRRPDAEGETESARRSSVAAGARPGDRVSAAAFVEGRSGPGRSAQPRDGSAAGGPSVQARARANEGPPPTLEAALDRFYKFLEATREPESRDRGRRLRELVDDLKTMGDVGAQALMSVLQNGSDSDERRAAARLLGAIQAPQALPALRDVLDRESDLLLRRAAAQGLRRLQTPESMPVMERVLTNPGEDRFVRLSAAYGLAESGRQIGVTGLTQIFEEATADGRGREAAFRALASLQDERSLPFMRHLVTAPVEPGYRLQAMKYLAAQGDRQSLPALQVLMQSPTEQPSVRDAAAQAHAAISRR